MNQKTHGQVSNRVLAIVFAVVLWVGFSASGVTPVAPSSSSKAAVANAAESEFKVLRQRDQDAREDMSRWLRETAARDGHLTERTPHFLSSRMEHRIHAIATGYMDFLARYPGHAEASANQTAFGADMAEDLEAIRRWEEARMEAPASPASWNLLAHYLTHNGRTVDAFACFEKSLDLSPREAVYFFDFATAMLLYRTDAMSHYKLTENELFDRVLLTYRRGLKLEPESFARAVDYAQTFYVIRPARPAEGQGAWENTLKLATTDGQRDEVRTHLARYAIHAGKLGIARLYLDQVQDPRLEPVKESLLRRIDEAAKATPKSGS